jgi:single-strand DNA-binding protein
MSSLNKVIIIGRLGADPELRYTADGVPVASFNVATTFVTRDKNGVRQERTEWHRIVAWRRLGEIAAEYLKKGRLVYVEGRIQSREFEGRDGLKRRVIEIIATNMKMLGGASEREERREAPPSLDEFVEDEIVEDVEEDVPL